MTYQQRIDRRRPGCFLFLVDQSGTMYEPIGGSAQVRKGQALSDTVNDVLYAVLIECTKDVREEEPRHYFDIGVIGYGGPDMVVPLVGGGRDLLVPSAQLPHHARVETRERLQWDGAGYRSVSRRTMVWLDPVWQGSTPMCGALQHAHRVLKRWVSRHRDSFPPIVLHVTDGMATDGDPRRPAARLRKLRTADGNLLLFNLHLSARGEDAVYFPAETTKSTDPATALLYEMSSELPANLVEEAGYAGRIAPGARGFVYNADVPELVDFMRIGTATTGRVRAG
ncbi:vWA domain-containing protein [Streptomyces aureoverticillatus]|uniref:vWA domain-containing protein n=1 Tax=Streptomyces aureoverticillatus TaxID=66871 RepID=UPI0013DA15F8|nr:vWA domain-containing protein [Streptomyces aureoverticillatus]QIB47560.1 VWA domain-containing protein [Streptomyces aureoverticillatus]